MSISEIRASARPSIACQGQGGGQQRVNAFTVDVEDYFQVEAFRGTVSRDTWEERPSRVVDNTQRLLDIMNLSEVRGTFFVLGWVAQRFPALVRRIEREGHEIGSHSNSHRLVREMTPKEFRQDIQDAKCILEDCTGHPIRGFRAPTFSIGRKDWWAYDILAEEGYEYSSSIYPILHDLYGLPDAPRGPFRPVDGVDLLEIPIATVRVLGANRACGGGGYFRLMPYAVTEWCIRRVNDVDGMSCVFYCHPWEVDPDQPRIPGVPAKSRFRHYLNLSATRQRLARLLRDFKWGRMDEVYLPSPVSTGKSSH